MACQLRLFSWAKKGLLRRPSFRMFGAPYTGYLVLAFLVGVLVLMAFDYPVGTFTVGSSGRDHPAAGRRVVRVAHGHHPDRRGAGRPRRPHPGGDGGPLVAGQDLRHHRPCPRSSDRAFLSVRGCSAVDGTTIDVGIGGGEPLGEGQRGAVVLVGGGGVADATDLAMALAAAGPASGPVELVGEPCNAACRGRTPPGGGWCRMGRASRNKRDRRARAVNGEGTPRAGRAESDGIFAAGEEWAAAVAARRCVRLLGEFGTAHPCLLTVMMNAVDQYLTDATAVVGSAGLLDGGEVGSGEVPGFVVDGFGTGMAAQRWREEFVQLGRICPGASRPMSPTGIGCGWSGCTRCCRTGSPTRRTPRRM